MINIRVKGKVYTIKTDSMFYNSYVKCLGLDEMDLSKHFTNENVETLQDIVESNITDASIDVDTYKLIDFLDLNYLLFNNNIQENSSVSNKRIKEYYEIMKYPKDKNFLKNLLENLKPCAIKLINYSKLQTFINVCDEAVKINNLECLNYAHNNDCPWSVLTCELAAKNGHLDCLKFAHNNDCPWSVLTCELAAKNGHLDCLKFAHYNGCPWDESTCSNAAKNGHLDCLTFAHYNGCPWDESTCSNAAENAHLACLKFAYDNACLWDESTCSNVAKTDI
jgi:hypothetical protein